MKSTRLESLRILPLAALLLGAAPIVAEELLAVDSPPDLTREIDFEREGQYYLGPTGAKGWMYVGDRLLENNNRLMTGKARQILITEVREGSAAEGVLQVGDVILGVDGKHFDSDARKCLGWAIDEAEKNENKGILELIRWRPDEDAATRQGTEKAVQLQLPVMGAYSDTAPYNCPKSKKILEDALKVLEEREDWGRFGLKALAFLATGEEKYIALVRDHIHEANWARPDIKISVESGGLVCWGVGYRNLVLTEYYLATKDEYVLPAIREYSVKIAMGQSNAGTWGHGFAWTSKNDGRLHGRLGGYGALNQAGLPCLLSLILAKKCGVKHGEVDDAIVKSSRFFSKFVGNGSIGYGFHRPSLEINANGRNGMSGNGKNGIAAVSYRLLGDRQATQFFSKLTASLYNTCEYGHSGNSYSFFWDPIGADCGGPKTTAAFLKELRWYYALTRQADGSFVNQPLGGHYGRGTLDATVSHVLMATLPRRAIYLTGKDADKSYWLNEKDAKEAVAAGRWRLADTADMTADELIDELDSWSPIAREWIAKALAEKEGDFIGPLMKLLKSDRPEARAGGCAALGYQGERAAAAVPALSAALSDKEPIVCIAAGYALARINAPARQAVPDMLRAVLAAEEEGLMRPKQQALAYSLGYAQGKSAPLYFDGILPGWGKEGDPLKGLDRELLYPTVAKLLKDPSGRTRGCGAYLLKFYTREDAAAMAQNIYDAVKFSAPNYLMFDDGARQHGLDLMARLRIEEGVPLCFETLDAKRWGQGVRTPHRFQTLGQYAGSAKPFLPRLRDLRWTYRTGNDRQLVEDAIRAIEEDKNPQPLVSLHTSVDERLAKDLAPAKDDQQRVRLCRKLINDNPDDYFYQAAALRRLVSIRGADAWDDVLAAVGHPNEILRVTAVKLGAELPGDDVTGKWKKQLATAGGARRAGILDILAKRGDAKMLPVMKKHLKHQDEAVRVAAIRGLSVLGGERELPVLIDALMKAQGEHDRAAAEEAIVAVCQNAKDVGKSVSTLLAARPDTTETPTAEAAQCSLLRVLGQLGGDKARTAVISAAGSKNATVSKTAIDALSTSPDPRATDVLLTLAESASNGRAKNAAFMGCLRRVITDRVPSGRKISLLKKLLTLGGHGRNGAAALAEFQWAPSMDSLQLAKPYLHEKATSETAAGVVVAIARNMDMGDKKQRETAVAALKEVLEVTKNETTSDEAKALLLQLDAKSGE